LRAGAGGILREPLLEACQQAAGQGAIAARTRELRQAHGLLGRGRPEGRVGHEPLPDDPQRIAGASCFEQQRQEVLCDGIAQPRAREGGNTIVDPQVLVERRRARSPPRSAAGGSPHRALQTARATAA
jgi:hypothetical protein